jgi:hypothetical protein
MSGLRFLWFMVDVLENIELHGLDRQILCFHQFFKIIISFKYILLRDRGLIRFDWQRHRESKKSF